MKNREFSTIWIDPEKIKMKVQDVNGNQQQSFGTIPSIQNGLEDKILRVEFAQFGWGSACFVYCKSLATYDIDITKTSSDCYSLGLYTESHQTETTDVDRMYVLHSKPSELATYPTCHASIRGL